METGEFYSLLGFIWVFFWVLILVAVWYLRSRQRERKMELLHQERMVAMESSGTQMLPWWLALVPLSFLPLLNPARWLRMLGRCLGPLLR